MMPIDTARLHIGPEPRNGAALRRVAVQDFSRRLRALERLDLSRASEQQAFDSFARAFNGYITRSAIIGTNGVFRARRNEGRELFEEAAELWYPPAELVGRGRFNATGESRFYASSEFHGAVFEMLPAPGDRLTVLVAGAIDRESRLELAHVGLERALVDREITGTMGDGLRKDEGFSAMLREMGIERRWLALDDFLASIGTTAYPPVESADRYKLTVAAAKFLSHGDRFDGLIYPSVGIDLRGFNLCLGTAAADRAYFPFEAYLLEIVDERPGPWTDTPGGLAFSVRVVRRSSGISFSGQIEWGEELTNFDPDVVRSAVRRSGLV